MQPFAMHRFQGCKASLEILCINFWGELCPPLAPIIKHILPRCLIQQSSKYVFKICSVTLIDYDYKRYFRLQGCLVCKSDGSESKVMLLMYIFMRCDCLTAQFQGSRWFYHVLLLLTRSHGLWEKRFD